MKTTDDSANTLHNYSVYVTKIGELIIASDGEAITALKFKHRATVSGKNEASELTDRAAKQIEEYLAGKRRQFDLPLRPQGTKFQCLVWTALLGIPYGETRSYKQIAQAIGNPNASRAVGMANNKNPISIIIPCHRVIGSAGKLVGYGGGLDLKKKLLDMEAASWK